jgi:hypothetical protein
MLARMVYRLRFGAQLGLFALAEMIEMIAI